MSLKNGVKSFFSVFQNRLKSKNVEISLFRWKKAFLH